MRIVELLLDILFPRRCIFCRKVLSKEETDLCHNCRAETQIVGKQNKSIPFIAGWLCVWYYKDNVRNSILRFKFYNARSYATYYAKALAMRLLEEQVEFDILSYVPTGWLRKFFRGYDQVVLLAEAVGKELSTPVIPTLVKVRQVAPQSRIKRPSARRANILGAYKAVNMDVFRGKRILLLDDIITTGSTSSECAKTLLTAGAKEVFCGAIALASHNKK